MPFSYFVQEGFTEIPHVVNKYCLHRLDDENFLVTTEHGAWIVLNKEEFDLLRADAVTRDLNLFSALEEKGVIITEKNFERVAAMYKERFHHLFSGISLHIVVPTLRCNQKCIYCQSNSTSMRAKGFDMDRKTAKKVVDFIFQSPSQFLTIEFQGGEPLVNFPVVQHIVEYAKTKSRSRNFEGGWWKGKKDINFRLVSNFTLMDDDVLDFLMKNNFEINTSLDGPKKLHNRNRPYTGSSYNKVVYWIDRIREKGYRQISAMPTVSKLSLKYPTEIVDEYIARGFDSCWMRPLNIAGMAVSEWGKVGYSAEEFVNFWNDYIDYVMKINGKGVKFADKTCVDILKRVVTLKPALNACLGAPCGACIIQAAYNQWGDVYTCDEARSCEVFKLGNVKEGSYKKIFSSEHALNFIGLTSAVSSLCDSCVWHPYCSPCLVSSFGSQNNLITKPNDFLCRIRGRQVEFVFKQLALSGNNKMLLDWLSDTYKSY